MIFKIPQPYILVIIVVRARFISVCDTATPLPSCVLVQILPGSLNLNENLYAKRRAGPFLNTLRFVGKGGRLYKLVMDTKWEFCVFISFTAMKFTYKKYIMEKVIMMINDY